MKDIKIAIACHKMSELPKNNLYIPVQVGSALSAKRLEMQNDDIGENISVKNAMYCELTAQYWAWKNWNADYYGLCHYRRFLYFGEQLFPVDSRKQIVAEILNEYTCDKYGLNDEDQMRNIIEENDCVVGVLQDVRELPTPYGNMDTAYEHWIAHDRALIMKNDLDVMLEIVKEKYPEIFSDAKEYLESPYFLGYNCFVMKKELFFQLCDFEFDVLFELEKKVDLSNYNQQLKRIYGFMGEILYSVFIYHLEKMNKYSIKHVPLLYFNYTDLTPEYTVDQNQNTIVIVQNNTPHFMIAPVLKSFLENNDSSRKYEIIIMHENMDAYFIESYKSMVLENDVNISFYNMKNIIGTKKECCENEFQESAWKVFLPWILNKHNKILILDWNHLILKNIDNIFSLDLQEAYIAAPLDVYEIGRLNGVYTDVFEYRSNKLKLKNVYEYINSSFMLMDLEKIRKNCSKTELYELLIGLEEVVSEKDAVNMIYEGKIKVLENNWSVQLLSNSETKHHIPYAPENIFSNYKRSEKDPFVIEYFPDDPWYPIGSSLDLEFWKYARLTPFYETFIAHMIARRADVRIFYKNNWIDKFVPRDTKRRQLFIKLFPKKSKRYNVIKKVYDWLGE